MLVLDEATSSLDSLTERALRETLFPLMRGRTAIARQLAAVLAAGRIYVLDDGRVVEQGTHEQLVAQSGLYAAL